MDSDMIKRSIKQILPNISDDCCEKVIEKLDEIGVETVDDLSFVHESDLSDILKLVPIRKLFQSWKSLSNNVVPLQSSNIQNSALPQVSRTFHKGLERPVIQLIVGFLDGKRDTVHVQENCLVEDLFRAVYDHPKCPKTCGIRLLHAGEDLENNSGRRLLEYGINNGSMLHLVVRLAGG